MSAQPLTPRADAPFDLYPYIPSDAAAYTFVVLFSIAGAVHLVLVPVLRSWFFIPLVLGCAGEAAGYYGRALNHSNIRNGGAYLLQLMLILASAPLIAATVYMTLGRVIYALDAKQHAIMSPRWTTKIYVLIDVVSFCAQMAGSAMQSSGDPAGVDQGRTIVIAGLGVQLVALIFFMINAAMVHCRLNRDPTPTSTRTHVRWERHIWMLYSVCTLIVARSVFRLIEFIEGPEGHTYKTEAYLYIFDSTLMFIAAAIIAVIHPGMLLRAIRKADIQTISREGNKDYVPLVYISK